MEVSRLEMIKSAWKVAHKCQCLSPTVNGETESWYCHLVEERQCIPPRRFGIVVLQTWTSLYDSSDMRGL